LNENFLLLLRYHNKEELSDRINFLDSTLCSFDGDEIKNDKYEFRLHYGIYCLEGNESDTDRMAEKAARALQMIKNDRQKVFEFYSESMQKKALDENEIESHMFEALEEREFLVYLQPKFDLHTGRQSGAEALVRWMHPEKGLLYPGRFIGVFEKNGFIVKLDMYMLDEICHRLKIWISKGYHPMPISLNISRLNLFDEEFVPKLIATLEQYGIPANLVQLEMSEQVVTNNIGKLSSLIDHLKDYGFLISIDNFGTGTTSMNTLYTIPVDELKLDRKFLLEVEKTDRGKNVIKSIIEMAKRLNINVVSEGVENKAQARMLQELGCDMIQGFAFSEPMPFREYENYAFGPRADEVNIW
jgi:EAL domain-containing protein (putative c-di-GMP-specific phosphodiesterase class I)